MGVMRVLMCLVVGVASVWIAGCVDPFTRCNSDDDCNASSQETCQLGVCTSRARPSCPPERPALTARVVVADGDPCAAEMSALLPSGGEVFLSRDDDCRYSLDDDDTRNAEAVALKARLFGHASESLPVVIERDACGARGIDVDVRLTALDAVCRADEECPLRCVVDPDVPTARCGFIDGGRPVGAGCAADEECDHGVCIEGLCSALCSIDDDVRTCAPSQICRASDALPGAHACVPAELSPRRCGHDNDCDGSGRICADLDEDGAQCRLPVPGRTPLGGPCADDGETDTCASGVCDDEIAGRCTRVCSREEHCDGLALDICTSAGIDGIGARLCMQRCSDADDCGGGKVCRARADVVDNAIEFACDGPRGLADVGQTVASGSQCQTNFSLQDEEGGRYCSVVCNAPSDCPSAAPRCIAVTLPRPDELTTQTTNACAREPI